jgi:hypothetical protein
MADEEVNQAEDLNRIIEAEMRCNQFAKEVLIESYERRYWEIGARKYVLPETLGVGVEMIGLYFSKRKRNEAEIPQQEWRRMLLLAPLIWTMFVLLEMLSILMIPWGYYDQFRQKRAELKKIKAQIAEIRLWSITDYSPPVKTLEALWKPYRNYKLNIEEVILVLSQWISVLYGDELAKTVNVTVLKDEILSSHINANSDFYQGNADAVHFHFAPLDKSLVRALSSRLPAYG